MPGNDTSGSTRQEVLAAIRTAPAPPTVEELAGTLGIHHNSVRLHVAALRRSGLITQENRSNGRRGRPVTTYATTTSGSWTGRRDYEQLASVLMDSIRDTAEDPAAEARRAGRTWGRQLATQGDKNVDMMVGVLHECGFEPVPDDDVIELRNCPFAELVGVHHEMVCGLHAGMLEGLVEGSSTSVELVPFTSPSACSVHVRA